MHFVHIFCSKESLNRGTSNLTKQAGAEFLRFFLKPDDASYVRFTFCKKEESLTRCQRAPCDALILVTPKNSWL